MRALLPEPDESVDLHSWYAQDWSEPGGMRLDMVASVDGAGSVDGVSRGLQTPGDNAVFAALRDLCDVILVGAGTARAEKYGPALPSPARQDRRRQMGYGPVPCIAVISGGLDLDPESALIAEAAPETRTLVITHAASDPVRRAALARCADVVVAGETTIDMAAARQELLNRGLRRILCEGGPSLLSNLVAAGVAEELCLSSTPWLVGPGPGRIAAGPPWNRAPMRAKLTHLLEEDGALFARYRLPTHGLAAGG